MAPDTGTDVASIPVTGGTIDRLRPLDTMGPLPGAPFQDAAPRASGPPPERADAPLPRPLTEREVAAVKAVLHEVAAVGIEELFAIAGPALQEGRRLTPEEDERVQDVIEQRAIERYPEEVRHLMGIAMEMLDCADSEKGVGAGFFSAPASRAVADADLRELARALTAPGPPDDDVLTVMVFHPDASVEAPSTSMAWARVRIPDVDGSGGWLTIGASSTEEGAMRSAAEWVRARHGLPMRATRERAASA